MKHQLMLDVPDTNNVKVFRIADISLYSKEIPVTCGKLQIVPPGFNAPVEIDVLQNFNLVLNACSLGIQSTDCDSSSRPLADGIYIIRYSISPNDKVYVDYNHLRLTQTLNKYYKFLSELELRACDPDEDIRKDLNELRLIKSFIDAAKANVEYADNPEKGMGLLIYAQKRLNKLAESKC